MDVDSWEEHRILGDFPASALVFSGSLQEPTVKLPTKGFPTDFGTDSGTVLYNPIQPFIINPYPIVATTK